MIYIAVLLLISSCIATNDVPNFFWENRPQLIAFTFKGPLNSSTDSTSMLSQFSNGRLACSQYVPATWFATDCTPVMHTLQSNYYEIAAYSAADQSNMNCLRSNASAKGVQVGNIDISSGFEYRMFDSSSYIWPYVESNITQVPFVNPDSVALTAALAKNYNGLRAPIVVSLGDVMNDMGTAVTKMILQEIMSLDEIVVVTTGQLSQLAQAKSAAEAESIVNICRNVQQSSNQNATSNITSMSSLAAAASNKTSASSQTVSQENNTSNSSTSNNGSVIAGTNVASSSVSSVAGINFTSSNVSSVAGPSVTSNSVSSVAGTNVTSNNASSVALTNVTGSNVSSVSGTNATSNNASSVSLTNVTSSNVLSVAGTNAISSNVSSVAGTNATSSNFSAVAVSNVTSSNVSAISRSNATINNASIVSTAAPATTTPNIIGQIPENNSVDPSTSSSNNSSSTSSSKSTGYVPYVIGIGGGLCAMAVAIVYKVFKREDRFPPVITNGYVFEAEDREIYDLEAYNDSVRAVSETPDRSSYVHSDLESVSTKS